jgi:UDP-N-acetylglucosamine 2-epimerase (hydrolysing)
MKQTPGQQKKIVFLTGTRADYGKIKSLITTLIDSGLFEVHIFVTGMHMSYKYGHTVEEITQSKFINVYQYINNAEDNRMDVILANTISGFGNYVRTLQPDMIIVHGDRIEALAGALVGSLNNILVAHIEGGEVSGTVDEHIRHAISKMSHVHFVAHREAKHRLVQMGENAHSIFVIGSPDRDIMISADLPSLKKVKQWYDIDFDAYAICMLHPVTTELPDLPSQVDTFVTALIRSQLNYVAIYPNNDPGNDIILKSYNEKLISHKNFKIIPSVRFEYFLTLMKYAHFLIGNSSAGIYEAPFYGVPSINVGSRQNNRLGKKVLKSVYNVDFSSTELGKAIHWAATVKNAGAIARHFGNGNSNGKFLKIVKKASFWNTKIQKKFLDIDY